MALLSLGVAKLSNGGLLQFVDLHTLIGEKSMDQKQLGMGWPVRRFRLSLMGVVDRAGFEPAAFRSY